ncbi:MAG: FAD-binding oxidoreductase [Verrucomicrobiota bacterium]
MPEVNDVQSRLNPTPVQRVVTPSNEAEVAQAIAVAVAEGLPVCVAGGRHAMGGQQFRAGGVLIDLTRMKRVVEFDRESGQIEVESGIMWPELIGYLHHAQGAEAGDWAIRQKQTGVDRVTIGGSLAANIHGRGLYFAPLVEDIEAFTLINAEGETVRCSRTSNPELFSLAIGGYGLFGVVTRVRLRLARRRKLKRMVEIIAVRNFLPRIEAMREEGFLYGDCQYSIDLRSDEEFHAGVFSCYKPVDDDTPMAPGQRSLSAAEWSRLYALARRDKAAAFDHYTQHYLKTSGQIYWSDEHQLSNVFEGYSDAVATRNETEMITEIFVPPEAFIPFLVDARRDFVASEADVTYGTIRLVRRDTESFLAWAREDCVGIICNLHVKHSPQGIERAAADFRRVIDRAIQYGGRYYLTYHRFASTQQLETCYPQVRDFLAHKRRYDPAGVFQSDWYAHYAEELEGVLG